MEEGHRVESFDIQVEGSNGSGGALLRWLSDEELEVYVYRQAGQMVVYS